MLKMGKCLDKSLHSSITYQLHHERVLEGFGALTAIAGGIALMMGEIKFPLAWLQGTPFSDYTIPGLVLFLVVGGGMLLAVATVFLQREVTVLISMAVGLFMMAFEVVEVASVDSKAGEALALALLLQVFYFVLGLAIFGLATYLRWAEYRGHSFLSSRSYTLSSERRKFR